MTSDRAAYDAVLRDLHAKKAEIENAIKALQALIPPSLTVGGRPIRPAPEPRKEAPTIIDGAMAVLKREDKPTHVTEIVRQLHDMGVRMGSEDKENTVGSILNRRRRKKGDVVRVGRGTWALADRPFAFVVVHEDDDADAEVLLS